MRFYVLPKEENKTVYINFDHVSSVHITAQNIEIYLTGATEPTVLAKNATSLSAVGKGMDLSDSGKDQLSNL